MRLFIFLLLAVAVIFAIVQVKSESYSQPNSNYYSDETGRPRVR